MTQTSGREFVAHVASALAKHSREMRREGVHVPDEVDLLAGLLADCARTRPDATSFPIPCQQCQSAAVNTLALTKREAASLLSVSLRTLERIIASGDLPTMKVGRAVRIRRTDLDAYIAPRPSSFRERLSTKGDVA